MYFPINIHKVQVIHKKDQGCLAMRVYSIYCHYTPTLGTFLKIFIIIIIIIFATLWVLGILRTVREQ